MSNIFLTFKNSVKAVFENKKYYLLFIISSLIMLFIYIYIPVFYNPGNDLKFFLQITPWYGYIFFLILALSIGLLITMQVYSFKVLRKVSIRGTSGGVFAGFSSVIAGVFSSATCAACISAVLAFLSPAAIFKLLEYRWEISLVTFSIVLVSLFLTSKKIENKCINCNPFTKK